MLNPDGVIVGNYRCSLAGRDLNRNYKTVLKESFPSVWHTKAMIKKWVAQLSWSHALLFLILVVWGWMSGCRRSVKSSCIATCMATAGNKMSSFTAVRTARTLSEGFVSASFLSCSVAMPLTRSVSQTPQVFMRDSSKTPDGYCSYIVCSSAMTAASSKCRRARKELGALSFGTTESWTASPWRYSH